MARAKIVPDNAEYRKILTSKEVTDMLLELGRDMAAEMEKTANDAEGPDIVGYASAGFTVAATPGRVGRAVVTVSSNAESEIFEQVYWKTLLNNGMDHMRRAARKFTRRGK